MSVKSSYKVTGMTCDHCVSAVTTELSPVRPPSAMHEASP